ncbi:hypothetical protein BBAD15_g3177 [Beauveria bassiana D1-5]|uniref:Uncharacterized protein n=1 Tax=Beauveria bassiana D1-5 TaxID=1245745 RepID=A0A0A2WDG1_BEABA|nr:hypothetical protein BBAD15_g3177 [Beauveria bassiana D1-5]
MTQAFVVYPFRKIRLPPARHSREGWLTLSLVPAGQRHPDQNSRNSDDMEKMQRFAEKHQRQHHAEDWNQVNAKPGACGADGFHAASVQQVGNKRGECAEEHDRRNRHGIPVRHCAGAHFMQPQRQRHHQCDSHLNAQQPHAANIGRDFSDPQRIQSKTGHGRQQHQITR